MGRARHTAQPASPDRAGTAAAALRRERTPFAALATVLLLANLVLPALAMGGATAAASSFLCAGGSGTVESGTVGSGAAHHPGAPSCCTCAVVALAPAPGFAPLARLTPRRAGAAARKTGVVRRTLQRGAPIRAPPPPARSRLSRFNQSGVAIDA